MDQFSEYKRFWEIDLLRGIAIILMIIFHALYDFNYFLGYSFDLNSSLLLYVGRTSAGMFIFLAGVSLTLSNSRSVIMNRSRKETYIRYIKRGSGIFSWGLIITFLTWLFLNDGVVIFGILHFIGISIILAYPFLGLRSHNLLIGAAVIFSGLYIGHLAFDFPWLLWLGLKPYNFYTLDYFPLLPWFGVVLIGIFIGNSLYPNYTRKFDIKNYSEFLPIRLLCLFGRRSLLIYLIHQPVLIALLYIYGFLNV